MHTNNFNKYLLGAIHTGNGETHINHLSFTTDMPPINKKVFKVHERIIGPVIESVAKESCAEAVEEERILTINNIDSLKSVL